MLAEAEAKLAEHRSRTGPAEAGAANAAAAPAVVPAAAPAVSGADAAPAEPEGPSSADQPAGHGAPHVKGMRRCGLRECSNIKG